MSLDHVILLFWRCDEMTAQTENDFFWKLRKFRAARGFIYFFLNPLVPMPTRALERP